MQLDILKEKLNKYVTYITHTEGYRLVYFYHNHHEVPFGLYAKTISDFNSMFSLSHDMSTEMLFNKILEDHLEICAVAIYDMEATCIKKKVRDYVVFANNCEVYKEELIYDYGEVETNVGYRVVHFYRGNNYVVGTYSKTIEGFMVDFVEYEPYDEEDIPEFISMEDLLNRYLLQDKDAVVVALYRVNGECVLKKERGQNKHL